jgi:hypothetical protein
MGSAFRTNGHARDDLTRRVKPVVYLPFAGEWATAPPDVVSFVKAGHPYKIKIYQGEVFEVADENRTVLSYIDYAAGVNRRKALFLWCAGAIVLAAIGFWLAARIMPGAPRET